MIAQSLGAQLRALTATLDGDVQSLYDELGVSFRPRFYPVFRHLLRKGASRVNDLARETGVSQPAATQTIAEMTRLGLVAATPGPDARERQISLAPHGAEIAEQLGPLWEAVEGAARDLNAELPMSISELITATIYALHRESFKDRIRRRLEDD